jgi:hypothetical protein
MAQLLPVPESTDGSTISRLRVEVDCPDSTNAIDVFLKIDKAGTYEEFVKAHPHLILLLRTSCMPMRRTTSQSGITANCRSGGGIGGDIVMEVPRLNGRDGFHESNFLVLNPPRDS